MKYAMRIFGVILAISFCAAIKIEAAYSWTDSEGTIHFSDTPPTSPNGKKVRVREVAVETQQNTGRTSPPTTNTNEDKLPKNVNNDTGYDSNIEAELRAVWSEFRKAVARKDANAAAS